MHTDDTWRDTPNLLHHVEEAIKFADHELVML
jgi:hypothetical protein